jgi:glyoxylase-like metal-dependent hydrolase (beta-lactamase superfamily II)
MDGHRGVRRAKLTCHCVLLETADRLILIDTGFGLADVRMPEQRLNPVFRHVLTRPQLREEDTAVRQIERLGFQSDEITDIILTHLDFDHAGGLDDFPAARVHLLEEERRTALTQSTMIARARFRPSQWASSKRWTTYQPAGEGWFGFDCVRELKGLPPEILLVPLIGHTLGHSGVAYRLGEQWFLHAGDAYFFRGELHPENPNCPIGLRFYQWLMEEDRILRLQNQERLRGLVRDHSEELRIFSAHDAVEFDMLAKGNTVPESMTPDLRTGRRRKRKKPRRQFGALESAPQIPDR